MNRREFLLRSTGLPLAALLHGTLRGAGALVGQTGTPERVAVGKGRDYDRLVRRAVSALGGAAVARPGEHVLIKPTLCWNRAPGQGANVDPEVLRAAIALALAGGASRVTICDRTSVRAATVHRISGAGRVVRGFQDDRVRLVELAEGDFVPLADAARWRGVTDFADRVGKFGAQAPGLRVAKVVLGVDRMINIATLRQHPTRRVAAGLSNLLGLVAGWPAHARWLPGQEADLVMLGLALRPELTLLDATRPVLANGPAGRRAADIGQWDEVAVSRDALAVDAWALRRFGVDPATFPHLELGESLGLGRTIRDNSNKRIIEV